MALAKRVKRGGSYYQGYELIVSAGVGDYILDIVQPDASNINSISVTPDEYGAGDKFNLSHLDTDENVVALLAKDIYNQGGNVATMFDFPALEDMQPGETLRLTYTSDAGGALNIHAIVEYIGIMRKS
jgi:hypothetical protein